MSEGLREVLSVSDGTELRVADAACGEKDVLRPEGEVLRCDDEAVLLLLETGHRAVREHRHLVVAEEVAEGVDDRRRLAVRGEEPSVGHAAEGDVQRLESRGDLPGRAFADRLGDEVARGADVVEELFGGDVLGEIAAAVRCHEHFRAEPGLALDEHAGDLPFRGNGRGEHAGGSSADDSKLYGCVFERHGGKYTTNRIATGEIKTLTRGDAFATGQRQPLAEGKRTAGWLSPRESPTGQIKLDYWAASFPPRSHNSPLRHQLPYRYGKFISDVWGKDH